MASKLAVYHTGYEDERFEQIVSQTLHCIICTNVIKDPVMCRHNEHLFCRACITIHLKNSQACPTCMEPLTVETLSQAPRGIRNLLAELKIRCEFFDRGCGKFVQLGDLESHVADCGFAPAICSNEGCRLEVNKQDLLHHETTVCELRVVKCHSCNDIRREMDTMKTYLVAMNEKLDRNGKKFDRNEKNVERIEKQLARIESKSGNMKTVVESVGAKVEAVQQQLKKQQENNRQLKADNTVMKESLNEITKQLERVTQLRSHEVQDEQVKKGTAEGFGKNREPKVVVAGGLITNSVEMFSMATKTWTPLQPMKERRGGTSSVVHNNQLFVVGGYVSSVERLPLNAVHVDQTLPWENVAVKLPGKLAAHCSVVFNGQLIVIGGYDSGKQEYLDSITEISLVPPYSSKLVATLPQRRCYHGVAIFGDKILIVGGRESGLSNSALRGIAMYDITKKMLQGLAPLPYPVHEMATVKWGDDNVMIMGGADSNGKPSNKVLVYNIKNQKSHELPDMKYKRKGCVATVVGDTVIVMGGKDERENNLKSVEGFRFDRYSWEELPPMHENRWEATAAVC